MVIPRMVVDTSVAFKWFGGWGEGGLDAAGELLVAHRRRELQLIAPSTIAVEIANTVRYLVPIADALELLAEFEATHLELHDTTPDLVRRATLRAGQTGMGVYDALFLALAEQHDCALATADHKAFADVETPIQIRLL
jgi:predicted nucleic acid-binding protein